MRARKAYVRAAYVAVAVVILAGILSVGLGALVAWLTYLCALYCS